jgi:hypothetical protein
MQQPRLLNTKWNRCAEHMFAFPIRAGDYPTGLPTDFQANNYPFRMVGKGVLSLPPVCPRCIRHAEYAFDLLNCVATNYFP